jgi:hypothetical protein
VSTSWESLIGRLGAAFDADKKSLKTYFGRKNLISEIRNKFSFHTDPDLLRKSFKDVPAEFSYEVLLGQENRGPNLFYGSEFIMIIVGFQHLKPNTNWFDAENRRGMKRSRLPSL